VPDQRQPDRDEQVVESVIAVTFFAKEQLLASLGDDAEGRLADGLDRPSRHRSAVEEEAWSPLDGPVLRKMTRNLLGELVPARARPLELALLRPRL